MEIRNNEI